jgi:hypothetical protein
MADEIGGICHKWNICYDNELEMNINDVFDGFIQGEMSLDLLGIYFSINNLNK